MTHQPLQWVDADDPAAGLVTEDGRRRYPVREGIPILLAAEAEAP